MDGALCGESKVYAVYSDLQGLKRNLGRATGEARSEPQTHSIRSVVMVYNADLF